MSARTRSKAKQLATLSGAGVDEHSTNLRAASTVQPLLREATDEQEDVDEDDLCPICRLLLFNPVTTQCNHTLCGSCMAQWADVSVAMPNMTIVSIDEEPQNFDAATGLEANCPMCRTRSYCIGERTPYARAAVCISCCLR